MKTFCVYILLVFAFLPCVVSHAQEASDAQADSLIDVFKDARHDTTKLRLAIDIGMLHYNVDTVIRYSNIALQLARKYKDGKSEALAESFLYWANYFTGDYFKSVNHAFRAIVIADSIGEKSIVAKNYHNLAIIYSSRLQDGTKGDEYYHKALEIYKEIGDQKRVVDVLRDIGNNNYLNDVFDHALDCFNEALEEDVRTDNIVAIAEDYMGLGSTYLHQYLRTAEAGLDVIHNAKHKYLKAIHIADSLDYGYVQYISFTEIPEILLCESIINPRNRAQLVDSAKMFLDKAYYLVTKFDYNSERMMVDHSHIWYLALTGKYARANQMIDSIRNIIETDSSYADQRSLFYQTLRRVSEAKGDYKKALEYQQLYDYYHRIGHKTDYAIAATQNMAQAKFAEQMQAQKQREQKLEMEGRQQRILIYASTIVMMLLVVMAIIIMRWYVQSRKANQILDQKNGELEQQKEEILSQNERLEEQNEKIEQQSRDLKAQNETISKTNKEMTDSINYASIIQQAVMPSERVMNTLFGQHLLIYRPLNIVSGDFYWACQAGRYKMLAVGDCTGHGVPGAILSMLGMSILDYLAPTLVGYADFNAAKMLDEMNSLFKQSLHQRGDDDNHDGIDIAIIVIDSEKMKLHYAGAFRPIVGISDGTLKKYNADRMPIGIHHMAADHFTNNEIDIKNGDVFYLFSDGMTDQFGFDSANRIHKFTAKRLRELLADVHKLPFTTQKLKIEMTIDNWRTDGTAGDGVYEQTDDAILVGIRL